MRIFLVKIFSHNYILQSLPKSTCNQVGEVVLEGHLKQDVRNGIEHGDAEQTIDQFTKTVERFANMQ